jgi:glycosyltransferase involved in cell wall biosynthesis
MGERERLRPTGRRPMTDGNPRVSIGLPVFNGERHLVRAVDSLLGQDYSNFELIISDNASTDATADICADYLRRDGRIRYYRNEMNVGALKNFNRTLHLASGEYFKWAAHDDWCAPEFLGRCVAVLDEDPRTVLCFSEMGVADDRGEVFRWVREDLDGAASPSARERVHAVAWLLHDCTSPVFGLMRTAPLRRIGGLPNVPELDRVLVGQLSVLGSIRQIPEVLFFHHGPAGHPRRNQWLWMDPSNARRIKAATPRIIAAYVSAVWRSDLNPLDKSYLTGDILVAFGARRTRSKLRRLRGKRSIAQAPPTKRTNQESPDGDGRGRR